MRLRSKRLNLESSIYSEEVTENDSSQSRAASRDSSEEESEWGTRTANLRRSTRNKLTPSRRDTPSRKVAPSSSSTHVARKSIKRLKLSPCNTPLKRHTLRTDTLDSSSDESVAPAKSRHSSALEAARQSLRVSSVPDTLPGRETEFSNVYSFLRGKLTTGSGGCMYISGVPGTGKTATSLGVVRRLQNEVGGAKKIPKFVFSHLNGMQFARPEHLYSRLGQDVFREKKKISSERSLKLLDDYFSSPDQIPVSYFQSFC